MIAFMKRHSIIIVYIVMILFVAALFWHDEQTTYQYRQSTYELHVQQCQHEQQASSVVAKIYQVELNENPEHQQELKDLALQLPPPDDCSKIPNP